MKSHELSQRKNLLPTEAGELALKFVWRNSQIPGVDIGFCYSMIKEDGPAQDWSADDASCDMFCDPGKVRSHTCLHVGLKKTPCKLSWTRSQLEPVNGTGQYTDAGKHYIAW